MAEISKITLPNGSVYDLKSNVANKFSSNRTIQLTGDVTGSTSSNGENGWSISTTVGDDSHNHTTQTIVPIETKTYTGLLGTASNDAANDSFYFMSIKPDDFYAQWKVTYRITATIPNQNSYRATSVVTLYGVGQATAPVYYIYNQIYSTSYRPYYYHNFQRLKQAGFNAGYGNAVGIGLRSSNSRDTAGYERTIKVELLETDLCTVTFLDNAVKWANWTGTGSTNYAGLSEFNGCDNGLQETGDTNSNTYDRRFLNDARLTAGGVGIFPYSLIMQDTNGTWQSLTTTGGEGTSKAVNTIGFVPGKIYWFYYNATIASGSLTTNDYIYETHSAADLRYTFNCGKTLTANKALYLVGTFTNGLFYVDSTMYAQDLPISEDGKCYMYLGEAVSNYTLSMSALHPVYIFKNGAIRLYYDIANATTSVDGLMSKDDKTKLNGIETGAQVNTITGVKGGSESSYRTGDVNITATNIGLGNLTNNKQVKGLSSGTTNNNLVAWGSDGYTVADSGIAKGSVTTKLALSGTNYSASSNTITVTKANLQSAVQDSDLVLMTAAERTKLASIDTSGNYVTIGGTQTITGAKTFSAPTVVMNSMRIGLVAAGTTIGEGSFTSGSSCSASGRYAHGEGSTTHAEGDYSHSEGVLTYAIGYGSHAEGHGTKAYGDYSHSEGDSSEAYGDYSYVFGLSNYATEDYQTVIGKYNSVSIDNSSDEPVYDAGDYAFIIGNGYYGNGSPVRSNALTVDWDGNLACAGGIKAGDNTVASGNYSIATGGYSTASDSYSHAEGFFTTASGQGAHAQGQHSQASGRYSHAEGNLTTAIGDGSHASGDGTFATQDYQTVIGKYNKRTVDNSGDEPVYDAGNFAFIIGNGTVINRSNSLTVDWNGQVNSINPQISTTTSPSSDTFFTHYRLTDSNGYTYGRVQGNFLTNGSVGITLQANRVINDTYYQNNVNLYIKNDGSPLVEVNHPWAWREALGFQKTVLLNGSALWNGTKITVVACGNIVTLAFWGSENGTWTAGTINAFATIPAGYRPYVNTQQIMPDQNNKRIIINAQMDGKVGVYYLLDSITSKTNVYGTMSWIAYQ